MHSYKSANHGWHFNYNHNVLDLAQYRVYLALQNHQLAISPHSQILIKKYKWIFFFLFNATCKNNKISLFLLLTLCIATIWVIMHLKKRKNSLILSCGFYHCYVSGYNSRQWKVVNLMKQIKCLSSISAKFVKQHLL